MKAFVIKNKEGKYFESQCIANGEPRFYNNQFLVFTNKDEAKAVLESIAEDCDYFNIACEVVEVTIAETKDLEKDFVSKNYHDLVVENYKIALNDFGNEQYMNESLVQQLAEKDEKIKELRDEIARQKYAENTTDYWVRKNIKEKEIRKQICEEIRAFFDVNPDTVEWDYLNEILNQIEQGEQQCK